MQTRTTAYWATTGLFCLVLGFSGFAHLSRQAFVAEAMAGLGFPVFVMTLLGTAKLLGVVALLSPGRPLLKEWAYAGFTFNLLGATASHVFAGDPLGESLPPALILALGVASYLLRPATRRLASAPTLADGAASPTPAASHGL